MSIESLYPLGICLTGNPFDSASPLLALRGGRGGGIPNLTLFTIYNKKRSFRTALEFAPNDEQTLSSAEHWPLFITLEAVLSDSQQKPLTKMSPFLNQKSIQGIVGTPTSVKELKSGALLLEVTKNEHSTSLLDLNICELESPQWTKPK